MAKKRARKKATGGRDLFHGGGAATEKKIEAEASRDPKIREQIYRVLRQMEKRKAHLESQPDKRQIEIWQGWMRCLSQVDLDDLEKVVDGVLAGDLDLNEKRSYGELAIDLREHCRVRSEARARARASHRPGEQARLLLVKRYKLTGMGEARDWSIEKCRAVLERLEAANAPKPIPRDDPDWCAMAEVPQEVRYPPSWREG